THRALVAAGTRRCTGTSGIVNGSGVAVDQTVYCGECRAVRCAEVIAAHVSHLFGLCFTSRIALTVDAGDNFVGFGAVDVECLHDVAPIRKPGSSGAGVVVSITMSTV